jgi:hypothetical protein
MTLLFGVFFIIILLPNENPDLLWEITNVLRLLCRSYKIRGKQVNNPVNHTLQNNIVQPPLMQES